MGCSRFKLNIFKLDFSILNVYNAHLSSTKLNSKRQLSSDQRDTELTCLFVNKTRGVYCFVVFVFIYNVYWCVEKIPYFKPNKT